ncbi:MAG: glutamate-5-semialdehyde dehydrogenase [Candidatus Nanopelagicales bacterium]|nr:glutamate-5-semialdehyde dehydrogenase [Candidatus Nanopelagicales bacterium]MCF8539291.1 glutamate-5-semialdehyde dehydrogenase [Candidatus Nanopelagicales bacterium]MCF8551387.1 glutamate-5-semialdehyde dehydrogenase [Candidatus Nanopelagicales bacterium]
MDTVREVAERARLAARDLRVLTRDQKDEALRTIAHHLKEQKDFIAAENTKDIAAARENGTSPALIDRLTLDGPRIEAIADSLVEVAGLPDPVGEVIRGYTLPNGLQVRQIRVPLGVVGMIYEARPNVTVDAAGLCLKSGNAALLRGSSSAFHTNTALVEVMRKALSAVGITPDAIALVPGETHESVNELMQARGLVDVLIPRGGESLIQNVVKNSLVPVIETGVGNCHVYVDKDADLDMAVSIVLNSKTQRVSVCNAAETLLVHEDIAQAFLPMLLAEFKQREVTVHADAAMAEFAQQAGVAWASVTDEDWAAEYYSMDIAAGVVPNVDTAIDHILKWTSGHTEAIVSNNASTISRFVAAMDSAAVMVNASTRFTDGGEFGFGAEIGISTQKLHARGPMGLTELTTSTFIVTGAGHIR